MLHKDRVALVTGDASGVGYEIASVSRLKGRQSRLDVLVSNAGIQHIAPIDELEFANWRNGIAIPLNDAFLIIHAAFRQTYRIGNCGAILFMGSVHSKLASLL